MNCTLFGSQGSGSAAVEMALRRCGWTYRVVRASTWEADSARAELAAVNPLGQIPTLVLPGGAVLTESAAILIHLGLAEPESGLLPRLVGPRAQAIRGLVFIAANCYAAISVGDYPERWTAATSKLARQKVRQAARAQLHRNWAIFADTFSARPWFCGVRRPGALEFLAVVVSRWWGTRAFLARARPALHETLLRIESHASVAPVLQAHWPDA
ncbi:MAG: glutathione S-transferase family protein [Rubrivivax sp.]|nr:glutathione S-transferase family protein [Rubrivivax sp.]